MEQQKVQQGSEALQLQAERSEAQPAVTGKQSRVPKNGLSRQKNQSAPQNQKKPVVRFAEKIPEKESKPRLKARLTTPPKGRKAPNAEKMDKQGQELNEILAKRGDLGSELWGKLAELGECARREQFIAKEREIDAVLNALKPDGINAHFRTNFKAEQFQECRTHLREEAKKSSWQEFVQAAGDFGAFPGWYRALPAQSTGGNAEEFLKKVTFSKEAGILLQEVDPALLENYHKDRVAVARKSFADAVKNRDVTPCAQLIEAANALMKAGQTPDREAQLRGEIDEAKAIFDLETQFNKLFVNRLAHICDAYDVDGLRAEDKTRADFKARWGLAKTLPHKRAVLQQMDWEQFRQHGISATDKKSLTEKARGEAALWLEESYDAEKVVFEKFKHCVESHYETVAQSLKEQPLKEKKVPSVRDALLWVGDENRRQNMTDAFASTNVRVLPNLPLQAKKEDFVAMKEFVAECDKKISKLKKKARKSIA